MPDTLQRLVYVTMRSICIEAPGPTKGFARVKERLFHTTENNKQVRLDKDVSDSAQISLAMAQRIDLAGKIVAAVKYVSNLWNIFSYNRPDFYSCYRVGKMSKLNPRLAVDVLCLYIVSQNIGEQ